MLNALTNSRFFSMLEVLTIFAMREQRASAERRCAVRVIAWPPSQAHVVLPAPPKHIPYPGQSCVRTYPGNNCFRRDVSARASGAEIQCFQMIYRQFYRRPGCTAVARHRARHKLDVVVVGKDGW